MNFRGLLQENSRASPMQQIVLGKKLITAKLEKEEKMSLKLKGKILLASLIIFLSYYVSFSFASQ